MSAEELLRRIRNPHIMSRIWEDIAAQYDLPGLEPWARTFRARARSEDQKEREMVEAALSLLEDPVLTDQDRELLRLRYVDGLPLDRIGEQVHYCRQHTHALIKAALERLDERSNDI